MSERSQTSDELQERKFRQMVETPIPKLIVTLSIPTIISMLVSSIYNMADTFFVGRLGTSATGAVGVVFSLMALIQAIGFTLGMGSGNYISRLLGQKNREKAEVVAATGFFTALALGALLGALGLIFLEPLVRILGATDTILPYAKDYASYILIGFPYMAASFVLNNILRYQGNAMMAMTGIATGGILNIVLDPIFIFVLDMGTGGAALATILSQLVSFCILLYHSLGRNGNLGIHISKFTFSWAVHREIIRVGMPSFYRQGLASLSTICLNLSAGPFGDAAIAAMSVVSKVFMFALSALLGFGQGFQPVCGFNYGASRYDRVREAFWFCVRTAFLVLVLLGTLGFIFAPQIVELFRKGDPEVIRIGSMGLRFQAVVFPLCGITTMVNMLTQSVGASGRASILAMSRQGIFFIPLVIILPRLFDVTGVAISQPLSDLCTFLLAVPLGMLTLRELTQKEQLQKQSKEGV
ncbi:MATE family efflux transporter [Angelakisella massiliensis]|uniref:MATE family efflux transporter n=1 Tax=Angelakisella massiliensis TaxID=1871018 RepID=UPI0023A8AFA3|nr:MATE family efflux transporter [Angelakisella massiliensis]